jgi:hypothetical protein
MSHGSLSLNDWSPAGRRIRHVFYKFLWDTCVKPDGLAEWCHARRKAACQDKPLKDHKFGRGTTREARNAAAGLKRAVADKATAVECARGLSEAAGRLTNHKVPIAPGDLEDIRAHAVGNFTSADKQVRGGAMPLPNGHSCAGHGRRSGGQKAAVAAWGDSLSDGLRRFRTRQGAYLLLALREKRRAQDWYDPEIRDAEEALNRELVAAVDFTEHTPDQRDAFIDTFDSVWMIDVPDPDEALEIFEARYGAKRDAANAKRFGLIDDANAWFEHLLRANPGDHVAPDDSCRRALRRAHNVGGLGHGCRPFRRLPARVDTQLVAAGALACTRRACSLLAERDPEDRTVAKLNVFSNCCGALRLATIHLPEIVIAARAITQWLLPRLKHIRTNKKMLRNEPITLFGEQDAAGYSADLKKGTDPISVETATVIVTDLLKATGAPEWLRNATPWVCGRMVLQEDLLSGLPKEYQPEVKSQTTFVEQGLAMYNGKSLTTGALMGLGPSWIVMSVLNSWAACRSGPKHAHQIQGDDLAAVWTAKGCDKYERRLERARLVPNRDKSFRGSGVVFCEAFGTLKYNVRTGLPFVKITPTLRLGEAAGVKSMDGDLGHAVCDRLVDFSLSKVPNGFGRTQKRIRELAARTAKRLALVGVNPRQAPKHAPGRVEHGGSGAGTANRLTFALFLEGGKTSTATYVKTAADSEASRLIRQAARALPAPSFHLHKGSSVRIQPVHTTSGQAYCGSKDTTVYEAQIDRTVARLAEDELRGGWRERCAAKRVQRRQHVRRHECRTQQARDLCVFTLLREDNARATWSAKQRADAHRHASNGRYAAAIDLLANHSRRVEDSDPPGFRAPRSWLRKDLPSGAQGRVIV